MMKQTVVFHNFASMPKNDMDLKILAWDQKKKKMKNSIMVVNVLRMKNVCVQFT
jgi:hypothetical protein